MAKAETAVAKFELARHQHALQQGKANLVSAYRGACVNVLRRRRAAAGKNEVSARLAPWLNVGGFERVPRVGESAQRPRARLE